MTEVDARLNRGELQALLAAIDCFVNDKHAGEGPMMWWKCNVHDRATFTYLQNRFEEELKLLGE